MEEWKEYRLGDFMEFNPKISLKKDTVARKITMDLLVPHSRDIYSWTYEPYSGGAKFQNGDTIMARITPCLENGKHAFISLLNENEIAYGSTEYIVMRGREGISDNLFVYYLTHFPPFKEAAVKSMVGTSGRQRAQVDVLENLTMKLPFITEQKRIANILTKLDDKIALNKRINDNLEQQAQALFKSWFVDFEPFRDGKFVDSELGLIPEGWRVGTLSELVKGIIAGDWGKEKSEANYNAEVLCMRGSDIPDVKTGGEGKMPIRYILQKNIQTKQLQNGNLVIEISGGSPTQSTGRCCFISNQLLHRLEKPLICTNFCKALSVEKDYEMYVYSLWDKLYRAGVFFTYENGTTGIKNLDIFGILEREKVIIPSMSVGKLYNEVLYGVGDMIQKKGSENQNLAKLRDSLLPKLMSGELKPKETNL